MLGVNDENGELRCGACASVELGWSGACERVEMAEELTFLTLDAFAAPTLVGTYALGRIALREHFSRVARPCLRTH